MSGLKGLTRLSTLVCRDCAGRKMNSLNYNTPSSLSRNFNSEINNLARNNHLGLVLSYRLHFRPRGHHRAPVIDGVMNNYWMSFCDISLSRKQVAGAKEKS